MNHERASGESSSEAGARCTCLERADGIGSMHGFHDEQCPLRERTLAEMPAEACESCGQPFTSPPDAVGCSRPSRHSTLAEMPPAAPEFGTCEHREGATRHEKTSECYGWKPEAHAYPSGGDRAMAGASEVLNVAKARLEEATNWHQFGKEHDEDGWCCKREADLRNTVMAIQQLQEAPLVGPEAGGSDDRPTTLTFDGRYDCELCGPSQEKLCWHWQKLLNMAVAATNLAAGGSSQARVREALVDLHERARAKAQKYIRSKTLYAEYHGIELAYETVLKLVDAESNRGARAAGEPSQKRPCVYRSGCPDWEKCLDAERCLQWRSGAEPGEPSREEGKR